MMIPASNCNLCKHKIKQGKCAVRNKHIHKQIGICNDFTANLLPETKQETVIETSIQSNKPKVHNHDKVWALFYP